MVVCSLQSFENAIFDHTFLVVHLLCKVTLYQILNKSLRNIDMPNMLLQDTQTVDLLAQVLEGELDEVLHFNISLIVYRRKRHYIQIKLDTLSVKSGITNSFMTKFNLFLFIFGFV